MMLAKERRLRLSYCISTADHMESCSNRRDGELAQFYSLTM